MRPTPYAGLVTRAIALLIDALVIDLIAVITGAVIALIGSLLGVGNLGIAAALTGGFLWLAWTGLYFIAFWMVTGQTPGARLLGIRVVSESQRPLGLVRASLRFIVMMLALIPLGLGYLTVLFDDRRRGPHDMVADTVARWASPGEAPTLTEPLAPDRASAPAFAPAGSAATPPRPAPVAAMAAAPPPPPGTIPTPTRPTPAASPQATAPPPARAAPPASFPPPATAAPRAAAPPLPSVPAQTTGAPPLSAAVQGEVVGPAGDDQTNGRVPRSGWDRARPAANQPPPTRFES